MHTDYFKSCIGGREGFLNFYAVTNGNHTVGYYRIRENADKRAEELNSLIKELEAKGKNVDKKPYHVLELKTED